MNKKSKQLKQALLDMFDDDLAYAAQMTGYSLTTIYNWISAGTISKATQRRLEMIKIDVETLLKGTLTASTRTRKR